MPNKFEQRILPEKPKSRVDVLLARISEINNAGGDDFFLPDGRIKFEPQDQKAVFDKTKSFFSADNSNVQEHYKKEYGADTPEKMVVQWKANMEKMPAAKWEKAATILLHRVLAGEFIVARASEFDDYMHGADNIILNKETGDVVCAFDQVRDDPGGERYDKKVKDFFQYAKEGGATIKNGLGFKTDEETGQKRLIQKTILNVPKFYLSVTRQDLDNLLSAMPADIDAPLAKTEIELFDKLLESLARQAAVLDQEKLPSAVKQNLDKFKISFEKMKAMRYNY